MSNDKGITSKGSPVNIIHNHSTFPILEINRQFHVYKPIAFAYINRHLIPPDQFWLDNFETLTQAQSYISTSLRAAVRAELNNNRKNHAETG